jgi:dihydropteroate synthase
MSGQLSCGRYLVRLDRPLIMGIINVTPDSFSGDGVAGQLNRAIDQARSFIEAGADILDIGGESSRPGAEPVGVDEELRRVMPVVEALARFDVPLSVDTMKPEVINRALACGASMINDINALRSPGALEAAAAGDAAVCLMHMQGSPKTMQDAPHYDEVVSEVVGFLRQRASAAQAAGIAPERIVIDPGFGFGKTPEHNLALLQRLDQIVALGYPVLVGLSRKSVLGKLTGRKVTERLPASVTAAVVAVSKGARIVRVHDVAATRDALAVWRAAWDDR